MTNYAIGLVFVGLSVTNAQFSNSLCYAVKVKGASGTQKFTLKPVTGFPSNHILTTNQVCGNKFSAGDPIPHNTDHGWSKNGASSPSSTSCKDTSSGGLFYAYNFPKGASSNTGFEQSRAIIVYFTVDDAGELSLVMTFDKPNNGNKGEVTMAINAPDLRGVDVQFKLRDDGHEPTDGRSGGQAQWNPTTGIVDNMYWKWIECCTDGVVLGNLPEEGFSLPFSFSQLDGLGTFKMGSWDSATNDISFTEVEVSTILEGGVTVEAATCGAYCGGKTSCGECSLDAECGWCDETKSCLLASDAGSCSVAMNTGDENCKVCAAETDCASCSDVDGCAWDHGASKCISANDDNLFSDGMQVAYVSHVAGECSTCPGAIYNTSDGALIAWCSGKGTCNWSDKTCTCDMGFGGADCGTMCPRNAAGEICSGQGTCGDDGACSCACGFKGDSCDEAGCPCGSEDQDQTKCYIGDATGATCNTVCGSKLPGNICTGFQDPITTEVACTCAEGWFGDDCTQPCPGINADGTGAICGGHGTCTNQGTCECTGCHVRDPSSNSCVPSKALECKNYGQPICNEATDFKQVCDCGSDTMWGGAECETCTCPPKVSCNPISGKCDFSVCDRKTQYQVSVGNATSDTVCGIATVCDPATQYTLIGLTTFADRVCRDFSPSCLWPNEFEEDAATSSSDRKCAPVAVCGVDFGTYQIAAATPTSNAVCAPLDNGGELGGGTVIGGPGIGGGGGKRPPCIDGMYESTAPTLTTDRICSVQPECGVNQYETLPAASMTVRRSCADLTICTKLQYEVVVATATSNRECSDYTPPCDSSLDLIEVVAPTATSDRTCEKQDDCSPNPCRNGGICVDGVLDFKCECRTGTAGPTCEFFDSCWDSPCKNGALCEATAGGAVCHGCPFEGSACCDSSASLDSGPNRRSEGQEVCVEAGASKGTMLDQNGSDASTSSSTGAVIAAVAGVVVVLFVVGITIRRKRAAREERDMKLEMETLLENSNFLSAIGVAKKTRAAGSSSEYSSIEEMRAAAGRGAALDGTSDYALAAGRDDTYSSANILDGTGEANYTSASGCDEAVYDSGNAGGLDMYGAASSGEVVYDSGHSAAGTDAVYDTGNAAGTDAVYDTGNAAGSGEATYDTGMANEQTYSAANALDNATYPAVDKKASSSAGETYSLATADAPTGMLRSSSYENIVSRSNSLTGTGGATYDTAAAAENTTYDIAQGIAASDDEGIQAMEDMYGAGVIPQNSRRISTNPPLEPEDPRGPEGPDYLKVLK